MRVRVSEIDMEILYMIARGKVYKEIAVTLNLSLRTIGNRMRNILYVFGAESIAHLIAILIASDVLRVHDLYQELDVEVFEYGRGKSVWNRQQSYRLMDVRP